MPAFRIGLQTRPRPSPSALVLAAIGCCTTHAGSQETATGPRFRIVGRIVEAVLRLVANRFRPKLNLLLPCEVKHRLPSVLEAVSPAARHTVVGLAPAEFVNKPPAPLPPVGDYEVLHVQ